MTTIRLLKENETELLQTAWNWRSEAPRWFVETLNSEDETFEDFIESAKDELLFGIFDDDLTAVIRLVGENGVYQIHLMAKRKTDWGVLAQAGLSIKQYLFDKKIVSFLFGWIPTRNKGIIKLYRYLGFVHNGEQCYRGRMRGHPIKWLLFQAQNS